MRTTQSHRAEIESSLARDGLRLASTTESGWYTGVFITNGYGIKDLVKVWVTEK